MILLGRNYIHCVAYTPQRILDSKRDQTGEVGRSLFELGTRTTAYSYVSTIGQQTTIARFCEHCQVVWLHFRTICLVLYTRLRHCYKRDSFQESHHMYQLHSLDRKSAQHFALQETNARLKRKNYSPATNVCLITVQYSY